MKVVYSEPSAEPSIDSQNWTITITHNGIWPFKWYWLVEYYDIHSGEVYSRFGDARTKDRAQHKAARARLSIERDDLTIHE